ncbi:Arabinose operon regulatory protein [Flagellimonas maritima]|uniref:Arabinose operon regulatory protein n=1 Tax=Flagellimonas maritima TaxID=1383885 RepID=A0A2Z4LRE2_9FLAO|nr:helix-turn-helix domain-containing protein [Allomuricauda aurantiaca]AWX44406.1 Arabinose operon regulatory protein [Allomuricauda aurantiaca]
MTSKSLNTTPYHDIASILELDEKAVDFKIQKPRFENELLHPYRGSYYCLLLLTEGSVRHSSNLETFEAKEHTLIFSSPGIINNWAAPTGDIDGFSLFFTAAFFKRNGSSMLRLNELPFFEWDAQHFLTLTQSESRSLSELFKAIEIEEEVQKKHRNLLIHSYITALLIKLERLYEKQSNKARSRFNKGQLAYAYQCLVSHHVHQNLSVKDYAEILNVTPNHLNDSVKKSIGKTAGALIQEMMLLEAKVLLYQTNLNVSEVAYHLNFEDPSYFGRFFKKHTRKTPFEYRKERSRHL